MSWWEKRVLILLGGMASPVLGSWVLKPRLLLVVAGSAASRLNEWQGVSASSSAKGVGVKVNELITKKHLVYVADFKSHIFCHNLK